MKEIFFVVFFVSKEKHIEIKQMFESNADSNPLKIEFIEETLDGRFEYQIPYICLPKMIVGETIHILDFIHVSLVITSVEYFYEINSPHESYFMYECECN